MKDFLAAALDLHMNSIVLDGHTDTPQRFVDEDWDWVGKPLGSGQLSAETARTGSVHGAFLAAWSEPAYSPGGSAERVRRLIAGVHEQARRHPDCFRVCRTVSEVRSSRTDGAFAALIGIEGGHAIENDLDRLREFFVQGARYMTLTWANSIEWCGSSGDAGRGTGLSEFGCSVVHEMNRLGMLVDVSHVSDKAFWDVLEHSDTPVIASHSSSRSLCSVGRNVTDEMAVALARKGGIVMVNFYASFLSDTWRTAYTAQRPVVEEALAPTSAPYRERGHTVPFVKKLRVIREYARQLPPVPFSILIDHFDHLLRLVGPDHVGIGSDFDGIALSVEGMESAADMPKVTAALLERGWSANDLKGLLGENLLRVMTIAQERAVVSE